VRSSQKSEALLFKRRPFGNTLIWDGLEGPGSVSTSPISDDVRMKNLSVHGIDGSVGVESGPRDSAWDVTTSGRIERYLVKIVAVELVVVTATCFLTSVVYSKLVLAVGLPTREYVWAALLIGVLVLLPSLVLKQHVAVQTQTRDRYILHGVSAVTIAFSIFLSLLFLFRIADWYSRGTFFCQFVCVNAAILIARGWAHNHVRRAIQLGVLEAKRVVLVGDANSNRGLLTDLRRWGARTVAVAPFPSVDERSPADSPSSSGIRRFVERCRENTPDDILLLAEPAHLSRIATVGRALSELPAAVHVIPVGSNDLWGSATVGNLGGAATIQLLRRPLSAFDLAIKRAFDICVAGLGLVLLSPLMLVVALAIKVECQGHVLFRQKRNGYNNRVISVLKFRTMTVIESGESVTTFTQATKNDKRITRFGRILRRTNIDELPQLINILRGEMSVVGPRPHPVALNAMFKERIIPFSRRHNVKPGLTGWAQVHGFRGETDTLEKMRRRVDYDLYYIEHWSFMLDLKIILLTLFSRLSYLNAY
jgi:Undecaprenyl-phosphate glucose phosphotransferase